MNIKNLELLTMNNSDKKNSLHEFFGLKLKNKNKSKNKLIN